MVAKICPFHFSDFQLKIMTPCVAQFLTWRFAYNTQPRGGSGVKMASHAKATAVGHVTSPPFCGISRSTLKVQCVQ